jgi:hypothetical protein
VKLKVIADGPNGMNPKLPPELRESAGSNWARFDVCSHEDALLRGVKLRAKGSMRRDKGHTIKKHETVKWWEVV